MKRILFWLSVVLWVAVFIWAATVCYFSSLTGPELEKVLSIPFWDKLIHFLAFAAGGGLLGAALAVTRQRWSATKLVLITAISVSVFGAIDEWHQLYTPKRSGADKMDWLADTAGGVVGALLVCIPYARRNSRKIASAPARA
jgi:VanZ family protein